MIDTTRYADTFRERMRLRQRLYEQAMHCRETGDHEHADRLLSNRRNHLPDQIRMHIASMRAGLED